MVTVVVFEFSGMRCQPLRRALAYFFIRYGVLLGYNHRVFLIGLKYENRYKNY
ncbi:acetyltransferase [Vibrio vulnificus]|nr:acetyltransferase [Vibrio vulnificus]